MDIPGRIGMQAEHQAYAGGVQIEKGANVVARQKHTYLWWSVSVVFLGCGTENVENNKKSSSCGSGLNCMGRINCSHRLD
jgi:hypothetical protein